MRILTYRTLHLGVFLSCAGLLGAAYYFEYVLYMEPCPLCIMQRIATLFIGLVGLAAAIHGPSSVGVRRLYGVLGLSSAALGIGVAARHVWIQSLPPDQVPACGPSLSYMLDAFPLMDAVKQMLRGDGSCADQVWSFMGLSMPQWTLLWFIGFAVFAISQVFKPWPGTEQRVSAS